MLHPLSNKQLPAEAWMPQPAASGQRGKAAQAVRKRTAKSRGTDPKTNSFVFGLIPGFFFARKLSLRL
jgi:hypothetical protein